MGITDRIEAFINELMKEDEEYVELGRNELAEIFNCVPSQINYVISTRFNPQKGYVVESRRGGGGYIKIKRIYNSTAESVIEKMGENCNYDTAKSIIAYLYNHQKIGEQAASVLLATVSDNTLAASGQLRDKVRADILKNALSAL